MTTDCTCTRTCLVCEATLPLCECMEEIYLPMMDLSVPLDGVVSDEAATGVIRWYEDSEDQ